MMWPANFTPWRRKKSSGGLNRLMFKCVVQMFGLPPELTSLRQVELELKHGATLEDVITGLRQEIPSLEGPVIRKGENQLVEFYKFNVNGRFYFDDTGLKLHPGDRIALLTPATGG
jgi:molybdopterin converting factor small subunit